MAKNNFFFRSKKTPEAVGKSALKQEAAKKPARPRRYVLLVEDIVESSRMQGVMIIGNIHGRVRVGDTMYLYQQSQPVKEVHVLDIELGPRESVGTAKDCQVGVCLDLETVEEVSRFAVLSSVRPLEGAVASRIIENQRMFGLMMEYSRLYTNSVYMDALLYELCYGKFVVPLYMDRPPVPQEDGNLTFEDDAFVGFRPLKKAGDDSQLVFPAFTDELASMAWKGAFQKEQPKRFATMQLPHLIQCVENGHAGLVINPFGPVPVYFPKELLDQVTKSEVFMERYMNPAMRKREDSTTEA